MKEVEIIVFLEMNKFIGGINVVLIRGDIKILVW